VAAFTAGAAVGVLGGMIGLGGAEFRLPLLIGVFGFLALQAVILNKAMSLVVVATALPARLLGVPFGDVAAHWTVAANLLAGSLVGAWVGASWATRMASRTLYRVLAGAWAGSTPGSAADVCVSCRRCSFRFERRPRSTRRPLRPMPPTLPTGLQ